jgi:hypothetical protein
MPLSRHFYTLDEVGSALSYRTISGEPLETMFWCKELIVSGCASNAISILFDAWLWYRGPFALEWLHNAGVTLGGDEVTEEAIILCAYQLRRSDILDNSVWNILALTAMEWPADHLTTKVPLYFPELYNKVERYFICAVYQKKAYTAWYISRYIPDNRIWNLVEWYSTVYHSSLCNYATCFQYMRNYECILGYRSPHYDLIMLCMAVLSVCLTDEQARKSFNTLPTMDPRYKKRYDEWIIGRIYGRIYSIPQMALYGTQRTNLTWSENNMSELNNVEDNIYGCPFWEEAIEKYATYKNKRIKWKSYDDMEMFYNKFFPDDIPDEWTAVEKKKSHGDGMRNPNEGPYTLHMHAKKFLLKTCRLVWTRAKIDGWLQSQHIIFSAPSDIVSLIKSKKQIEEQMIYPRHKVRRL